MADLRKSIHVAGHGRYKTVSYKTFYGTIDGSWTGHCCNLPDSLPRYKNVKLLRGLTNNKPDFRIQVKVCSGRKKNGLKWSAVIRKTGTQRNRPGLD